MLHAPTSESKRRSAPARTNVETQREHELHPRLGESAQREHFAGLQLTIGNQAVLRMLAAPKLQRTAGNQGVLRRLPPISRAGAPVAAHKGKGKIHRSKAVPGVYLPSNRYHLWRQCGICRHTGSGEGTCALHDGRALHRPQVQKRGKDASSPPPDSQGQLKRPRSGGELRTVPSNTIRYDKG